MFSAYFTLILVIIHYLFDYQNIQSPVDRAFINLMTPRSWNTQRGKPTKKWTQALEAAIVMYSDTQIFTGIAILLDAFLQLRCGISTYHWQIAVDLAWFTSLSHFATLTSLRKYFRKRPKLAIWRVFFMGTNLILLMTAMAPTGYVDLRFRILDVMPVPAKCLFTGHLPYTSYYSTFNSTFNKPLIALTYIFLLSSYVTRVIRLFKSLSEFARKWFRILPGNLVKNAIQKKPPSAAMSKLFWYGSRTFLLLFYVLAKAVYEINESILWEVCTSTPIVFLSVHLILIAQLDNLALGSYGLGHPQTDRDPIFCFWLLLRAFSSNQQEFADFRSQRRKCVGIWTDTVGIIVSSSVVDYLC